LPLANEVCELMTLGAVNSVYIGFTSNPGALEERVIGGERVRLIGDCEVMEVSLLSADSPPRCAGFGHLGVVIVTLSQPSPCPILQRALRLKTPRLNPHPATRRRKHPPR
jgi:hypothetical protein